MSAQEKGGCQSPPLENQGHNQAGPQADGRAGAASTDSHAKDSSEDTKARSLESNPKGPLEDAAQDKVSK